MIDHTPFNTWQMANCAGCGMPSPCEVRENNIKLLEAGILEPFAAPCPLKVSL